MKVTVPIAFIGPWNDVDGGPEGHKRISNALKTFHDSLAGRRLSRTTRQSVEVGPLAPISFPRITPSPTAPTKASFWKNIEEIVYPSYYMQTRPLLTWLLSKDKLVFNKTDLSFAKSGVTASKG